MHKGNNSRHWKDILNDISTYAIYGLSIQCAIFSICNIFLWILPVPVFYATYLYSLYLATAVTNISVEHSQKEKLLDILNELYLKIQNIGDLKTHLASNPKISSLLTAISWFFVLCLAFNLPAIIGTSIFYIITRLQLGKEKTHQLFNIKALATCIVYALSTKVLNHGSLILLHLFCSGCISALLFLQLEEQNPQDDPDDLYAYSTQILTYLILSIIAFPIIDCMPWLGYIRHIIMSWVFDLLHIGLAATALGYRVEQMSKNLTLSNAISFGPINDLLIKNKQLLQLTHEAGSIECNS